MNNEEEAAFKELAKASADADAVYRRMSRPAKVIIFLLTPLIVIGLTLAFLWGFCSAVLGGE